ncbi:hypothetical protein FKM82_025608 [Ascaphus truei]
MPDQQKTSQPAKSKTRTGMTQRSHYNNPKLCFLMNVRLLHSMNCLYIVSICCILFSAVILHLINIYINIGHKIVHRMSCHNK